MKGQPRLAVVTEAGAVSITSRSGSIVPAGLLLFLLVAPVRIAAERVDDRTSQARRSVVIVNTYDDRGAPLSQGTGFFVARDQIVTNCHVIKAARTIRIKTFSGKTNTVRAVIIANEQTDLALLRVENTEREVISLELDHADAIAGESVTLISNPVNSRWKISHGQVHQIWDFSNGGKRIEISAAVMPGSSGGPVINQQGRVIGVAVMHVTSADDLFFAIPSSSVLELQAAAGL
jgi:S1-C subfamily serine protease